MIRAARGDRLRQDQLAAEASKLAGRPVTLRWVRAVEQDKIPSPAAWRLAAVARVLNLEVDPTGGLRAAHESGAAKGTKRAPSGKLHQVGILFPKSQAPRDDELAIGRRVILSGSILGQPKSQRIGRSAYVRVNLADPEFESDKQKEGGGK